MRRLRTWRRLLVSSCNFVSSWRPSMLLSAFTLLQLPTTALRFFPVGRGAHGSGTGGYGSESPVLVLEIVEPEPNREGVSRLRFRFKNRWFQFRFRTGGFSVVFLRFFTVSNRQFFMVPAWFNDFPAVFRGSGTVLVQKFLNMNRTTVQKSTASIRINSHGFGSKP